MQVLWDGGAGNVQKGLQGQLAYTTVQTTLNVLQRKVRVKRNSLSARLSTVPPSLKRQPTPTLSRTSCTQCFKGQWMASSRIRQMRRSMRIRKTGLFQNSYKEDGDGSQTEIKDTLAQEEHIKRMPTGQIEIGREAPMIRRLRQAQRASSKAVSRRRCRR
jgi:hypothetical protein